MEDVQQKPQQQWKQKVICTRNSSGVWNVEFKTAEGFSMLTRHDLVVISKAILRGWQVLFKNYRLSILQKQAKEPGNLIHALKTKKEISNVS